MVDKKYCMSSYLMYRTIVDAGKCFKQGWKPELYHPVDEMKLQVYDSSDLEKALVEQFRKITKNGKAALALSGGIDSAILAKCMPAGSRAYTFQCVVPGISVTNEVPQAACYAEKCGLEHKVVEIYWEDFEKYAPVLMKHKKAPIHSIEIQIYKAALQARKDGFDTIIFGESADLNYAGLSGLMSREWTVGEFIDRYSYVLPYYALRDFEIITEPIVRYEKNGYVDVHEFCRGFFLKEAMGSYTNACECAGIKLETPYVHTWLSSPLDYTRVRAGENKYIVRELFHKLYPEFKISEKLPMPRPVNEWFKDWEGPTRPEFWPHCTDHMTGDQKWMVWCLERFLNMIEQEREAEE